MPKKGKKGVEQRTKGNVKAASSGRMTELMGGDSGFIGFDIVSSTSGNNGSMPDEVLKSAVTSNFQTALKQMSKRDTTTKMKALNEFISLCDRESAESVLSCLKLWPLMYGKVSTDNDHRVRELSHVALRSCGLVVKKQLGPHVRSLMGPWVSGMCDPHSHTAVTAQNAFTDIFSPEKQMEVYKFTLKDVVLFIQNLVLKESSDTYTDPKIYPEDECIERYERAVSMAICGLGYILRKLGTEYLYEEDVAGVWQEILKQNKLWKLSRHKNPLIRSSVFRLVCSLADSTHYLQTDMKLFCSIVFGSISECDPMVIGPLWDAVLFIMDSDKEWASYVNIQKSLLPGLWLLLEGGGHGNGGRVFPCLLPLINGLVRQVYTNDVTFSLNFLQRLSKSFKADSVRMSTSETEAIMSSLKECFALLIKLNANEPIQFMKVILDLFNMVMSEDVSTLQYDVLSKGVAVVIINGLKIASDDSAAYEKLVDYCRDSLTGDVSRIISNIDTLSPKVIERLGDFLISFHSSHTPHPQSSHAPNTLFILPVICKACSLCLLGATPTQIGLFQRLVSHYNNYTDDLVTGISKHVKPDQPVDANQLNQLVSHMISLCDHNKIEPLLVDSVVSLLCSKRETDTLVAISKEKRHLAPLIVAKVAQKGYDDIGGIVQQLEDVLVPVGDTVFLDALSSPYYLELLTAMLTVKGVSSLQQLSLSDTALKQLCDVLMKSSNTSSNMNGVTDTLSHLHVTIVERNGRILTQLLNYLHGAVFDCQANDNTISSEAFISCYTNILPHLPNKDVYVSSVVNKLLKRISNAETLNEVMWSSMCFKCLHCNVLDIFESLYQLMVTTPCSQAINEICSIIPSSVFQMFCDGLLLYSPSAVPIPLSISSSIPKSLFPFLLIGICLLNDKDILQDISEDRIETNSLLRNTITINNSDDMIVPALFFISAVSIYSNKGSLAYSISHLAMERLLNNFNNYSKLVLYLIENLSDSTVSNLCLNAILHVSHFNDTLMKTILSYASELKVQLVLHNIEDQQIVENLLKQNQHDPCIITGCLLLMKDSQIIAGAASLTLSTIVERHNAKELTILDDDADSSRDPMVFSVLELMVQLVRVKGVTMDTSTWDFIMCQSVAIVQLLLDTYKWLSLEGVVMYCRGLSLCCQVHSCLSSLTDADNVATSNEWKEFFLPTIQEVLLPHLLNIKGSFPSDDRTFLHYYLCKAVIELSIQPSSDKWEELIAMVSICRLYSEQVTGFLLAQRVIRTMTFKCTGDETEGVDISHIQNYISSFLFNFDVDSIFDVATETDQDAAAIDNENTQQTVSYLLLWLLICEIVGKCDIEARVVLTEWIKEKCQLNTLLKRMFPYCSSLAPQQLKGVTLMPSINHLSNTVYFSIAQHLPPMLRQWYNSLDKQVSTLVMNFTSKNVTPRLWSIEVKNIHSSKPKASDLEVKVYSTSMEVFVAYRVDDFSIELSVNVPECYPLLAPTIREGKRARVDVNLWRKWLLQLSAFVANQNGTILEGLMVWKSNLDKHFAGLEDCMICFSVIHGSNYSLPKMCCRTCKKKFHSTCLYKWFSTSAKSTCPLCRNVF